MSAPASLRLEVWRDPMFRSWGVTEFRGEDLTDTETQWSHRKATAVAEAKARLFDNDDPVEAVRVFSQSGNLMETITNAKE